MEIGTHNPIYYTLSKIQYESLGRKNNETAFPSPCYFGGELMRVVFFDFFDTLLDKVSFDFEAALNHLYSEYIDPSVEKNRFLNCVSEYRSRFMVNRNETLRETSFHQQIDYYKERLLFKKEFDYHDLEWEIFKICRKEKLGNGVIEILQYFKERGFKIVVISNSIFSSITLGRYAYEFGIGQYIDHIFSSADVGYRKPSKDLFEHVRNTMGIDPLDGVYFIGNNPEKDVLGARMSGLHPIFYCRKGEPCDVDTVYNLSELKEYFDSRYIYVNSILPYFSAVDGPGFRTVLFLQGCDIRCVGCHNPSTWHLSEGSMMKTQDVAEILKERAVNHKITISGGEPLMQKTALLKLLKQLEGFDLCLYTSHTEQEVPQEIKDKLRYLKLGRFEITRKQNRLPYIGSDNQKFIRLR
jgi:anaerobic ribonucleoside-triphosphate reductase activating protein